MLANPASPLPGGGAEVRVQRERLSQLTANRRISAMLSACSLDPRLRLNVIVDARAAQPWTFP
jgi:hypothetical protein